MTLAIPLESMTTEEKILAMELIWADLSSKISNIASPYWHQTLLTEREQSVQQGLQQSIDWETAKHTLRQKLNTHYKILPTALQDLENGYHFYEQQSQGLGVKFRAIISQKEAIHCLWQEK